MSTLATTATGEQRLAALALTSDAARMLTDCEQIIERGLATFVEVGQALLRIRDERLYRESHKTFEAYCRERWGMNRAHAYRQIEAAKIAGVLSPIGDTPASESVARELVPLLEDEADLAETWRELRAEHGPKLTAAKVRLAVNQRLRLDQQIGTVTSSLSTEYYTPQRYLEAARKVLGTIDLDPASCAQANETVRAARYFTAREDGLAQEWDGTVYMNPPYGRDCPKFVAKLLTSYERGDVTAAIVLLSSYSSDVRWFQPLFSHLLCFVTGRIEFNSPVHEEARPTTGSVFAYVGPDWARFAEVFGQFGAVVARWPHEERAS
ncbi:MAG TPA: DNA N-6-adenine-methyltransferase [Coriobacteriia bacterium]|nr:DNA N-6-adenine-methyltransferase [Coriobacteriia bacterium]